MVRPPGTVMNKSEESEHSESCCQATGTGTWDWDLGPGTWDLGPGT